MITAHEIEMIMAEAERRMAPLRARFSCFTTDLMVMAFGRKVHAQRARKLRRRGAYVVRLTGSGKPRFAWMPRLQNFALPDQEAES